jgi:hypothetical protein
METSKFGFFKDEDENEDAASGFQCTPILYGLYWLAISGTEMAAVRLEFCVESGSLEFL